jgi:hypothetical protein
MLEYEEEPLQPFRVTPGFVAFAALLLLPLIAAVAIYLGASIYAGEVHAAEAAANDPSASGFNTVSEKEVAGWKKTLVSVCPIH